MSNFEVALIGVGVVALALFTFTMGLSRWHDWKKRHAHQASHR